MADISPLWIFVINMSIAALFSTAIFLFARYIGRYKKPEPRELCARCGAKKLLPQREALGDGDG